MQWAMTVPSSKKRQARKLKKKYELVTSQQSDLSESYSALTEVSDELAITIKALEERSMEGHKTMIDGFIVDDDPIKDKAYKDKLKAELDRIKEAGLNTLKPLRQSSEKLRANMLVSQEKALQYMAVVQSQQKVAEAGYIQVGVIKGLQEEGGELASEIAQLVADVEEINKLTDEAVKPFKTNLIGGRKVDPLVNPILEMGNS